MSKILFELGSALLTQPHVTEIPLHPCELICDCGECVNKQEVEIKTEIRKRKVDFENELLKDMITLCKHNDRSYHINGRVDDFVTVTLLPQGTLRYTWDTILIAAYPPVYEHCISVDS